MINTQRLLIIFFIMSILLGLLFGEQGIYETLETNNLNHLGQGYTDQEIINIEDDTTWYASQKNTQYDTEATIGSSSEWGGSILNIIWNAINPWSINVEQAGSTAGRMIIILINLIRTILSLIATIEVYMLFKNKKTS